MKKTIPFFVCVFLFQSALSQIQSSTLDLEKTYVNKINNIKNQSSLIENVNLRLNLNRFDELRTSGQLRIKLNSFGMIKTNKEEINLSKQLNLNSLEIEKNEMLKSHYDNLIKYIEIKKESYFVSKSLSNCKKNDSLYNLFLKSNQEINYKNYITNKQTLLELKLKSNYYYYLLDSIKTHHKFDFNTEKFIKINLKEIKKVIDSLKKSNIINIYKKNQNIKTELLQANINHLKSKNKHFINDLILSYNFRDDLIVNNRYGIGVNINLPWLDANNKKSINKLELEKITDESKNQMNNITLDNEVNRLFKEFDVNCLNYEALINYKEDESWLKTYNLIVNSGKISIFEILEFEKFNQNIEREVFDYSINLLKIYIELLSMFGCVNKFQTAF